MRWRRSRWRRVGLALGITCCSMPAAATKLSRLLRDEGAVLQELETATARVVRQRDDIARVERDRVVLEQSTAETQRRLHALERRITERKQQLRQRLHALAELSYGGHLRLLLEAHDASDLLFRQSALGRLLERDQNELRIYQRERRELQQLDQQLQQQRRRDRQLAAQLDQEQTQLKRKRALHLTALRRVRRSRRAAQQLAGELSRGEQYLLSRVTMLRRRVRNAGGFAARRGRLSRPIKAPISSTFGRPVDAKAGLMITRSGVTFGPGGSTPVYAVYSGTIRMADELPGYGRVALLDHGDGYFTLYGFLGELRVADGQEVHRGTLLGRSGVDPLTGRPAFYFEVRHHRTALDPTAWLRPTPPAP